MARPDKGTLWGRWAFMRSPERDRPQGPDRRPRAKGGGPVPREHQTEERSAPDGAPFNGGPVVYLRVMEHVVLVRDLQQTRHCTGPGRLRAAGRPRRPFARKSDPPSPASSWATPLPGPTSSPCAHTASMAGPSTRRTAPMARATRLVPRTDPRPTTRRSCSVRLVRPSASETAGSGSAVSAPRVMPLGILSQLRSCPHWSPLTRRSSSLTKSRLFLGTRTLRASWSFSCKRSLRCSSTDLKPSPTTTG